MRLCFVAVLLCSVCWPSLLFAQEDPSLLIELSNELENLRHELKELRNKNEELEYQLHTLQKQFTSFQQQASATTSANYTDKSIAEPAIVTSSSTLAESATPSATDSPEKASPEKSGSEPSQPYWGQQSSRDELALYDKALAHLEQLDYPALRHDLKLFLEQYPDSAQVPSAHYWLAESFYDEQNYQQAMQHYNTVINQYRNSPHYQTALLKKGYIFVEQEQWLKAKRVFTKLLEQDDENIRSLAQAQLDRIANKGL